MKLFNSILLFSSLALAGKFTTSADEFKRGDELVISCAQIGDDGQELTNSDGTYKWVSPTCVETRKPLALYYGKDGPIQCSVKADELFHQALLRSLVFNRPIRCRVARNKLKHANYLELPIVADGAKVKGSNRVKRVNGNFNVVFNGEQGNLVAGAIFPIIDKALPETVSGVTTMQFSCKWYEGVGLDVLMVNLMNEAKLVIKPVVAVMLCIITACLMYVVGRVYVENSVIPNAIKQNKEQGKETKKTK